MILKACLVVVLILSVFLHTQQRAIFRENFKKEDFKVVKFQGNSTSLWDISPPSRDALQAALNPDTNSNEIRLIFSWQVSR